MKGIHTRNCLVFMKSVQSEILELKQTLKSVYAAQHNVHTIDVDLDEELFPRKKEFHTRKQDDLKKDKP